MKSILKQTSWLFLAQALGRVIGFFYTIFLARNLGVSDFGLYSAALAYFSIFSSVADFGFNRFLVREVSLNRLKTSQLLSNIAMLRLTFTSVLFALFALLLYIVDPDKIRVSISALAVMTIVPLGFSQTLDAVFVAIRKLEYSAITQLVLSTTTTTVGIFLVSSGFGTFGAVDGMILGYLVYIAVQYLLIKKMKISIRSQITFAIIKKITIGSLIYGLLGVIGLVSFKVDTIILSYFRGNFETGIYGAAFRLLEAVAFVPAVFATALLPVLTKLHQIDKKELKAIYVKSLQIMLLVGLITTLVFLFVLPEIIKTFLPNYLDSIRALKVLSLAIPFIFLHIISNNVLLTTDKYLPDLLKIYIGLALINIVLYLIFIPKFGFMGASWVSVYSEVATFVTFLTFLLRKVFR